LRFAHERELQSDREAASGRNGGEDELAARLIRVLA
jgi:hypothetical protein